MAERTKFVLGLKADDIKGIESDDSDGNFFSSDDDEDFGNLSLAKVAPPPPKSPLLDIGLKFKAFASSFKKISNFMECSAKIKALVNQFTEIQKSEKSFSSITLIPETPATIELTPIIENFVNGTTEKLDIDTDSFDMNICCQIDMIRYTKDSSVDLKKYENSKLDQRISSLLFFLFANSPDNQTAAFYLIRCLEEYAKYPSFAPVSMLFKDFTIESVTEKLATAICKIFPKHPILESVIHSLASIDPIAATVLEKIKKEEEESKSALDDSDEMSDSFFASLRQTSSAKASLTLTMTIDDTPKNPLDIVAAPPKIEEIKVKPPPSTVTYLLDDGTEQLGLQHFVDWVNSFNPPLLQQHQQTPPIAIAEKANATTTMIPKKQTPKIQISIQKLTPIHSQANITTSSSYQSQPIFANDIDSNSSIDISKPKEYNEDYFYSLFDMFSAPTVLLQNLPNQDIATFFPIYYPTLEFLNQTRVSAAVKKGCPYPKLIESEYNAHTGLKDKNTNTVLSALSLLLSIINVSDWPIEQIVPLKEKRAMPTSKTLDEVDVVSALGLADIEFLVNGRSPLTGERISAPIDGSKYMHPAVERALRVTALYNMYTKNVYPPYIAMKLAFALALGVADSQPRISCDLIFEGMYIFSQAFPQLKQCPFARNAMLFLGEALEKTGRYFNAAMAFDVFLKSDINDDSASSDIAQIAYRNRDMLRACYHYNEAIKRSIGENNQDQALYLCNTAAGIYSENGLAQIAINLYSYLLKNTYNLTVSQRRALNKRQMNELTRCGSMKARSPGQLQAQMNDDFKPPPENINTSHCGCMCVELLIKTRMFKQADELLTAIQNCSGTILGKLVTYLRTKLYIKQNMFKEFIANFPRDEIHRERSRSVIAPSRTSIDAGVTFDSKAALMILLAKAYLDRNIYKLSLFWSEMIINSTNKKWYKDLGVGFFYRGHSFFYALNDANVHPGPYSMIFNFETQDYLGKYIDEKKMFTKQELAAEALSSFQTARFNFDRVGAIKKSTEASLLFLDTAISLFYNNDDPEFTVTVGTPNLLTSTKGATPLEPSKFTSTFTKSNVCDEISVLSNITSKNTARLMNPIFIIYSQILQARIGIMKGEIERSKTFFDYSFNNLKKYFVNGPIFLPKSFSIHAMNTLVRIVELMVETLLSYEKDFINEHLVIFDIFNDIQITLHNKQCNKIPDADIPLSPSINFDSAALELHNPKLPSFIDTLKDLDIVDGKDNELMNVQRGFSSFFKIINANVHLFESQKLTEEEMHERNKQICHKLAQIAENERRNQPHLNPVDSSFNVALKINGSFIRTIFIFRVLGYLIIYIPATGAKRKIPLISQEKETTFSIKSMGVTILFQNASQIASNEFFQQTASFIFVDKKNHDIINKKETSKGMIEARDSIFSELLKDENIFGLRVPSLPDDNTFDERSFFQSNALKGALKTLALGAPLIFYTGQDIAGLPLEYMFQDTFVVRAQSFTRLLLHTPPPTSFPSVTTLRYEEDRDDLLTNGISRSIDVVKETISNLGSNNFVLSTLAKLGRKMPYPFPLFSSNKTVEDYAEKYEFSSFVLIKPSDSPKDIVGATLFIFTYADMVEMPELISKLMFNFPFSFFMFIPAGVVREAYKEMNLIFARHKNRMNWVEKNKGTKSSGKDTYILKSTVLFIGALQRTLMDKLKVPIALFSPLGQE